MKNGNIQAVILGLAVQFVFCWRANAANYAVGANLSFLKRWGITDV